MKSTPQVLKRTLSSCHLPPPILMTLLIGLQDESCYPLPAFVCAWPLLAIKYCRQTLMVQISYTLSIGIASAAIYSVLEPIAKDTGLTLGDLNAGTGYMVRRFPYPCGANTKGRQFLLFGWGCLVWQPLALQYGKRPAYLLSMLATMASNFYGLIKPIYRS